jgi:hypothetical protein
MGEWWQSLSRLNQGFYAGAMFFSVFFVWQMIAAFIGLGGDELDADAADAGDAADAADAAEADGDGTYARFEDGAEADAAETTLAFRLLSVRSILTFCTMFTWGTALYLNRQWSPGAAMGCSVVWGGAGMFAIALLFHGMRKLAVTGTANLSSCVGTRGTVYAEISEGGTGEARVTVSGVVTYVKARSAGGRPLKAGTPVRVTRRLDQVTIEVEPATEFDEWGEGK